METSEYVVVGGKTGTEYKNNNLEINTLAITVVTFSIVLTDQFMKS